MHQNNNILTFHYLCHGESLAQYPSLWNLTKTLNYMDNPSLGYGAILWQLEASLHFTRLSALHYREHMPPFTVGCRLRIPLERTWSWIFIPLFQDLNNPYMFWGAEPSLVDASSREPAMERYDWTARSFLCYAPDAAMTKHVVPILAFEWGFWIENYRPYIERLHQLNLSSWNEHLELFRSKCTGWNFDQVNI